MPFQILSSASTSNCFRYHSPPVCSQPSQINIALTQGPVAALIISPTFLIYGKVSPNKSFVFSRTLSEFKSGTQ